MSPETLLQMRGVDRNYGNVIALAGIELDMHRGEAVVLLGPNGAGKTTLARIAAGYLEPSSGTVKLSGATVHNPGDLEVRSQVAFVADVPALYDDLTVLEHVNCWRSPTA
jgi:ABC-2 type transport system ATP-binding protein